MLLLVCFARGRVSSRGVDEMDEMPDLLVGQFSTIGSHGRAGQTLFDQRMHGLARISVLELVVNLQNQGALRGARKMAIVSTVEVALGAVLRKQCCPFPERG